MPLQAHLTFPGPLVHHSSHGYDSAARRQVTRWYTVSDACLSEPGSAAVAVVLDASDRALLSVGVGERGLERRHLGVGAEWRLDDGDSCRPSPAYRLEALWGASRSHTVYADRRGREIRSRWETRRCRKDRCAIARA